MSGPLLHLWVEGPSPPGPLFEALVLLVAAVVLLDQHGRAPTLLELLLLVVAAELALNQDGGQRHLLIKCILAELEGENGY